MTDIRTGEANSLCSLMLYSSTSLLLFAILCGRNNMDEINSCHSQVLLWPPCVADVDIIFFPVVSSIFLSFFPRLISAVGDWMSTIFHGVALVQI